MSSESLLEQCEDIIYKEYIMYSQKMVPSLFSGHGGIALFYAHYYQLTHNLKYLRICRRILDNLLNSIEHDQISFTFSMGLAGIGWLVQQLCDMEIIKTEEYSLEEFDKYLNDYSIIELKTGNYDFLHGGIGAGIYFINRPVQFSTKYINEIIDTLYETATFDDRGVYWMDKFTVFYDQIDKRPRSNFGLAHGMSSIIYFLSKVYEKGISVYKTESLLRGIIKFIISNQSNGLCSFFPDFCFQDKSISGYSRLAWCYGDLSILISFFIASKALNDNILFSETQKIAILTCKRIENSETSLVDGGLCHGYSGVSLIYKTFYQITNNKVFRETSDYWYKQLIKEIEKSGGPQKFNHFLKDGFVTSFDLLTGLTGAALVIMTHNIYRPLNFEKCLLLA
jgi:lantibiotic modifying enzyme